MLTLSMPMSAYADIISIYGSMPMSAYADHDFKNSRRLYDVVYTKLNSSLKHCSYQ